jgi:hypothetical protein
MKTKSNFFRTISLVAIVMLLLPGGNVSAQSNSIVVTQGQNQGVYLNSSSMVYFPQYYCNGYYSHTPCAQRPQPYYYQYPTNYSYQYPYQYYPQQYNYYPTYSYTYPTYTYSYDYYYPTYSHYSYGYDYSYQNCGWGCGYDANGHQWMY